jgi:hypothetical protein
MKTTYRITLLLLMGIGISIILLPSCDKIKEATTFKVKYDLPDSRYTIDQSSYLKTEIELFSQSYSALNIDSIASSYSGFVKKVSFYKLKFSIVTPESAKINFINSARITLTPAGGIPIEIATTPVINATDRTIDFVVKDVDILEPVKKPFIITLYGSPNGTIPTLPMEVLLESGLEFTISPLK